MSYCSYATQTDTEQYLFLKLDQTYTIVMLMSLKALQPTSCCNAFKLNNMTMIMNMEDKLNIHELKHERSRKPM